MSATAEYIHPLMNHEFPIDTSRIEQLMLVMQQWLWVGTPGGFVYGIPRVGKTFGVKHCAARLKTRTGGQVPFVYHSTQREQAKTNKRFWAHLLVSMQRNLVHSHTAIQLNEQVLGYLDDLSRMNHERQIILCIDEAQDLTRTEAQWLISLHNVLCDYGIRMLVIQVGTMELKDLQAQYSSPEDGHIKGRFFHSEFRYSGFKGKADLHAFLSIFDETSCWQGAPAPSRKYFANSPLDGMRLCDFTDEFLSVWRSMIRPLGYEEWPSFYLIGAVRTFLLDYMPRIRSTEDIESYIAGAVKASGILLGDDCC